MRDVSGIVVSITDYKENDALVHVLTRDEGTLTLYVRGFQKITSKNAPSIMPFLYGEFMIEDNDVKSILNLRSVQTKQLFRHIREDLALQSVAVCLCDYAKYASTEMSEEIFDLLYEGLCSLEKENDAILVLLVYLSQLCRIFGIAPYVDGCVVCGENSGICSVSVSDGGFVCEECFDEGVRKTRDFLWLYRAVNKAKYENIKQISMTKAVKLDVLMFVFDFIEEHTSFVCKGRNFVLETLHL